jgi:hypothetical protein
MVATATVEAATVEAAAVATAMATAAAMSAATAAMSCEDWGKRENPDGCCQREGFRAEAVKQVHRQAPLVEPSNYRP